jgi:hypothetical protein
MLSFETDKALIPEYVSRTISAAIASSPSLVLPLDPVPKHVKAVILLFPIRGKLEELRQAKIRKSVKSLSIILCSGSSRPFVLADVTRLKCARSD